MFGHERAHQDADDSRDSDAKFVWDPTGSEIIFVDKFPTANLNVSIYMWRHCAMLICPPLAIGIGGSVLNMLADRYTTDPNFCCKVPQTTGTIFIAERKEYSVDFRDVGHQFESLVTAGADPSEASGIGFTDRFQIRPMQVGKFSVLVGAEVDALSAKTGLPIEIKASNPRYWGKKVMLQMISSGSTALCAGSKHRGTLVSIKTRSLSSCEKRRRWQIRHLGGRNQYLGRIVSHRGAVGKSTTEQNLK